MDGHFIRNGEPFRIHARAKSKEEEVQVILTQSMGASYRAEKKDFPAEIPSTWIDPDGKTRSIDWVNNFGIKKIGKPDFEPAEVQHSYEVILDEVEGKMLVYYDSRRRLVKPFLPEDLGQPAGQPGKISVRLNLGDPPIGRT